MLLLISVAILPLLPDQGFGPFDALNPYVIWWMVVLIAGIHFAGYVAVRLVGGSYGILLTGMVAGLMASTPLALAFSRMGRGKSAATTSTLAGGILAASSMMFPRILLVAAVIAPGIFATLAWPLLGMAVVGFGSAAWLWRRGARSQKQTPELPVQNPFEPWPALQFGLLLALIMLTVAAAKAWLGEAGLYIVAVISGLTDVDPATLSFAKLALDEGIYLFATNAIVLAAISNTLFKWTLVWIAGGKKMGLLLLFPMLGILATGGGLSLLLFSYHH